MDKKTYYVSSLAWMISIFFLLIALAVVLSAIAVMPQVPMIENSFLRIFMFFVLISIVVFVVYIALLFLDIPTMHLELSDEGMILYSAGYRIYTPWENIAEVAWLRAFRSFPYFIQLKESARVGEFSFEEGIVSRRAVSEKRHWWMPNRQLKAEAQYTHYIRIPVALLRRKDKKEGSINQYLQYYLPEMMATRHPSR